VEEIKDLNGLFTSNMLTESACYIAQDCKVSRRQVSIKDII